MNWRLKIVRSIPLFAILYAFAFGLACSPSLLQAADLIPIKFRQSFIPSEQYIPEQIAIDKKFYEAQGLSVEMLRSTGGANATTLVAAGNDQIGIAGASDVLIAQGKGLDVIGIAINTPQDPTAFISLRANPIRSIAELRGKRVGAIAGSTAFALLRALLASNKLNENDIKIVLIGAGDLVSAIMGQRVDAIAAFETTNVPAIRAAGGDPVSFRFADAGLRVPGNVYMANGEFARTHHDVISRFIVGTVHGWEEAAKDDGKEGLSLVIKAYPELAGQRAMLGQRWEFRTANNYNPYASARPVTIDQFKFDRRSTETLNSALIGAGSIAAGIDLQKVFSNEFVDSAQKLMK